MFPHYYWSALSKFWAFDTFWRIIRIPFFAKNRRTIYLKYFPWSCGCWNENIFHCRLSSLTVPSRALFLFYPLFLSTSSKWAGKPGSLWRCKNIRSSSIFIDWSHQHEQYWISCLNYLQILFTSAWICFIISLHFFKSLQTWYILTNFLTQFDNDLVGMLSFSRSIINLWIARFALSVTEIHFSKIVKHN